MKTNRAVRKRFKVTGTGKLLRKKQGRKHLLTKKSSHRKRRLATTTLVGDNLAKKFKQLIQGM